MRFAAYAGTSLVLATGVVVRALHERANFYSACVYLAQSNACLMVLTNIALLGVCTGMIGLQKLFYGPLRPIEVEQLYEKAWFAITETCLAMTIFREEVGGWFLVMFVCLLVGKVWGWIGEGRVEVLEQQPPSNPRLFHARLSFSLIISTCFDVLMLRYSIGTVLRHARPNMMVMFAFEFAVLTVTSLSTAARYTISLHETSIIGIQTRDRRSQMRREREAAAQSQDVENVDPATSEPAQRNHDPGDIDSLDVDVPGWEEKGRWVFYLDLATDFLKLILYLTFFCVLCMFYGMPIHIIRDVALTIRSFYKRIADFVRYRQATKDMNARYPDATSEEVAREDVCIICREDLRPWQNQNVPNGPQIDNGAANQGPSSGADERLRPKKLPCGHILHFACLRSWLERQQICPTCRRSVLVGSAVERTQERGRAHQEAGNPGYPNIPNAQAPAQANPQQRIIAQNVFNLGPLRIAFGARQGVPDPPQRIHANPDPVHHENLPGTGHVPHAINVNGLQRQGPALYDPATPNPGPASVQSQILHIEQQINRDINGLLLQQNQLYLVRALQGELARLRTAQSTLEVTPTWSSSIIPPPRWSTAMPQTGQSGQVFTSMPDPPSIGYSHPNLPPGMTLPPGWTVLPLQRLPDEPNINVEERESGNNSDAQNQVQAEGSSNSSSESASNQPLPPCAGSQGFPGAPEAQHENDSISRQEEIGNASYSAAATTRSVGDRVRRHDYSENYTVDGDAQSVIPELAQNAQSQTNHREEGIKTDASTLDSPSLARTDVGPHDSKGKGKGKGKASTVEDFVEDQD
ncbi:E3 ubiquitin-protein ligase hrd1 [Lecanora helva]